MESQFFAKGMAAGLFRGMVGASLLLSAVSQAAQGRGDMTVVGKFTASRCEVIVPNDGVYDLGRIHVADKKDGPMALPPMTHTWRVQCDHPTFLAVVPEDNRADAVRNLSSEYFGFGYAGGEPLGYFQLGVSRAQIDRRDVVLQSAGLSVSVGGITSLLPAVRSQWGKRDNTPGAGQAFAVDITVFPWLIKPEHAVTDNVLFDGSVTLNFVFGL